MVPLVVIAVMLVVQVALAYYARQVVAGAVQDGAATGATYGFAPADGASTAETLIDQSAGHLTNDRSTTWSLNGDVVTVSSSATVVKVFPLFPTFTVSAESSATLERFRPQGSGP